LVSDRNRPDHGRTISIVKIENPGRVKRETEGIGVGDIAAVEKTVRIRGQPALYAVGGFIDIHPNDSRSPDRGQADGIELKFVDPDFVGTRTGAVGIAATVQIEKEKDGNNNLQHAPNHPASFGAELL
jgi:hypothetical protein